ncbi:Uncharacterised protein [Mycobacteroides abscessus subsp. abscessus]|nr:Uncharacterised protein [Mycobacteroides abscessus subsp. abscessus]
MESRTAVKMAMAFSVSPQAPRIADDTKSRTESCCQSRNSVGSET